MTPSNDSRIDRIVFLLEELLKTDKLLLEELEQHTERLDEILERLESGSK